MAKKHVQYTQKELVIISIIDDDRYEEFIYSVDILR